MEVLLQEDRPAVLALGTVTIGTILSSCGLLALSTSSGVLNMLLKWSGIFLSLVSAAFTCVASSTRSVSAMKWTVPFGLLVICLLGYDLITSVLHSTSAVEDCDGISGNHFQSVCESLRDGYTILLIGTMTQLLSQGLFIWSSVMRKKDIELLTRRRGSWGNIAEMGWDGQHPTRELQGVEQFQGHRQRGEADHTSIDAGMSGATERVASPAASEASDHSETPLIDL